MTGPPADASISNAPQSEFRLRSYLLPASVLAVILRAVGYIAIRIHSENRDYNTFMATAVATNDQIAAFGDCGRSCGSVEIAPSRLLSIGAVAELDNLHISVTQVDWVECPSLSYAGDIDEVCILVNASITNASDSQSYPADLMRNSHLQDDLQIFYGTRQVVVPTGFEENPLELAPSSTVDFALIYFVRWYATSREFYWVYQEDGGGEVVSFALGQVDSLQH